MLCAKCNNATLYPDGMLRCDLEYDQKELDRVGICLGQIEGRYKMYKPEEKVVEEKVQALRVSKPKVSKVKISKRKSKAPPKGQGAFKLF